MQFRIRIATIAFPGICSLCLASAVPAFSQSEIECMQSFAVNPDKTVTYIASDPSGSRKPSVTITSCVNAELFREKLYISIDKNTYDSEATLRAKLSSARNSIQQIQLQVNAATDAAKVGALIKGAGVIVATPLAITTTATCASGFVTGVGLAACGGVATASLAAVVAWYEFTSAAGDLAATKQKANAEIDKIQAMIVSTEQQLNAAIAGDMKNNYSQLFVGICRAVKAQCL